MPLKDFSKKLIPGLMLTALLTMGASTYPDNNSTTDRGHAKSVSKKAISTTEDNKAKPVHSLFTYVNSLSELQGKLKAAKSQRKPVMVEFFASWCPACRAIDAQVLSQASVQHLMAPFVKVRVDLTNKNAELMQIATYYNVYGTPTFLFYDKNGNEYSTDRFKSIDDFKDVLIKVGH